jgi:cold shock CspA family protein
MEKGIIYFLVRNKGYGFIRDTNGDKIFFHANNLINVRFEKLEEGNIVYFEAVQVPKGYEALKVERQLENKTTPGINPNVKLDHFDNLEKSILTALSRIFYLTNGGGRLRLGTDSQYSYCLLKTTSFFSEQFNLNREIVLIFSNYETFEPRTLDAISKAHSLLPELRLDKICSIVISKDPQFEAKLKDLLKSNAEMQVIIPFSYSELLSLKDNSRSFYDLVIERFRTYFYERDLFAFFAPLQKDLYFFGRQAYVQDLVNKHFSHENSGVFGLRRSGKTSVLNAVHRTLDRIDGKWVWIDGQLLSHMRWNASLYYLVKMICQKFDFQLLHTKDEYTFEEAAILFEQDMIYCSERLGDKSLLLLFDEIEHITFDIALSNHWSEGEDFIYFWRSIRAYYQKYPHRMTFIIAGTNPKAIETSLIKGYDNPLFKQLPSEKYLGTFSVQDTKEMINKLGAYMGIRFDDIVCANITQEMGGHPFLIRQLCSRINTFINRELVSKPIIITKAIYDQVLPLFEEKDLSDYCEMILDVLRISYPEEHKMLECIALEDGETLSAQKGNNSVFSHLIGYGLIEKTGGFFGFRNEAVKKYIQGKNKYCKLLKTDEEKWAEISERRNSIEPNLRKIVKLQLKASLGEQKARIRVLAAMLPEKAKKYNTLSYNDLFSTQKCEVYFYQMSKIINDNWTAFSNVFSLNKQSFQSYTTIINNLRSDCHAASVTDSEMQSFRGAISYLEKEIHNAI